MNSANNICDICVTNDGSACWVIDNDDTVWYMTGVSNMMSSSESQTAYQVSQLKRNKRFWNTLSLTEQKYAAIA